MGFTERVVESCVRDFSKGCSDELKVQDILRCKKVDVSPIEKFLDHKDYSIKLSAIRIIGEKGDINILKEKAIAEENDLLLVEMLKWLGKRKAEGLEVFTDLLKGDNNLLREAAIQMFRDAGKSDLLFPMLFDKSDTMVNRTKRYLDEQKEKN